MIKVYETVHCGRFAAFYTVGALWIGLAGQVKAGALSLAWDPNSEPGTQYIISYGTQSGVHPSSVDVGDQTTWTFTSLTDGQVYYFIVQAYNDYGMSPKSAEVSGTPSPSFPCTYAISPTSAAVGAGSAVGSVAVSTSPGCAWTASSTTSWVAITAGASGSGNGL